MSRAFVLSTTNCFCFTTRKMISCEAKLFETSINLVYKRYEKKFFKSCSFKKKFNTDGGVGCRDGWVTNILLSTYCVKSIIYEYKWIITKQYKYFQKFTYLQDVQRNMTKNVNEEYNERKMKKNMKR